LYSCELCLSNNPRRKITIIKTVNMVAKYRCWYFWSRKHQTESVYMWCVQLLILVETSQTVFLLLLTLGRTVPEWPIFIFHN
jgi:hypothetical protein